MRSENSPKNFEKSRLNSPRDWASRDHNASELSYERFGGSVIVEGESDINSLKNLKNVILSIRAQFDGHLDPQVQVNHLNRDDLNKRMILVEKEIDGLMRRRINFTSGTNEEGQRTFDLSTLLGEKENQIVELEKKVQNIEHRLRKATARELELENYIVHLNEELRVKEDIIGEKSESLQQEVSNGMQIREAMFKIQRNIEFSRSKAPNLEQLVLADVKFPDLKAFEIRSDSLGGRFGDQSLSRSRSLSSGQEDEAQRQKARVVSMFREFERLFADSKEFRPRDIERVLEGYLISDQGGRLYEKHSTCIKRDDIEQKYHELKERFALAASIYEQNLQQLRRENPSVRINLERNLFQILRSENVRTYSVEGGVTFVDSYSEKTVEVPIQDSRSKHLVHLFATEMKKLTLKYPQLLKELDERLCEFFQQEIIDCIEVDEVDRLVNIVKYVPQVVKVENVYAYSSEKTRKVEFHLRVLIKALLEEIAKIQQKTGVVLEIDEGIVGMMKAEIMGVVDVDDILKVFRPVPKIVEVEKVVEKIVERQIEIPKVVEVRTEVQKIVEKEVIKEVQKVVHVPIEMPIIHETIVEKIVEVPNVVERVIEVPTIVDRIVYLTQEVVKVEQVPTYVEKIVEVEKVVEVERVVNHIQQQPEEVRTTQEKIVPVETVVEKIVEVPVVREKIVEKIVEVPKIEIVERVVEKAVPVVEYRKALQVSNHIETVHKPVDRVIEKIVPVQKIVERIVEVPQIVEKIVEVVKERVELKEVQVVKEKIIEVEKIKEVQVPVTQVVELVKQQIKEVEKVIQVPVVQQVIKKVEVVVEKPIIETVEKTVVKEVEIRNPQIVYQPRVVEIQKIVNHVVEVIKPVEYTKERIVEIPRNVEKIKEVRTVVEKIVEKMVEVPKVVEVEKVVEKVVVVPRVVEKFVEIPKIVEKIVEKNVEVVKVEYVDRVVQMPVIQEKIVEVEKEIIKYIEVEKVVDRIVDKLVTVDNTVEKVRTEQIKVENVVEVVREVPKVMTVENIVPAYHEKIEVIEVERPIVVPHEVPVPVEVISEKFIPVRETVEKILQVPQFIEKIVETKQEEVRVELIEKVVEKIVVDQRIKEVERVVPYINEVIKEIPTMVEKIVTVETKVQDIITAQQIIEKIVERSTTIPRIYQVEKKVEKMVEVPMFIEIEKVMPKIIKVNQYIQKMVEKIIEVPTIVERIKEIEVEKEKVVTVNNFETQIKEVEKVVEKVAIMEQIKEVLKDVHHIEKVISIVEKIERMPVEVSVKEEVLVEVPYILEKIVEKVVVMPQIVEVLKYVHEVCESEESLLAVDQEHGAQELKFRQLSNSLKGAISALLSELRPLKSNPQYAGKIQLIESFIDSLSSYINFPKVVKVPVEKVVEKEVEVERIVKVPVKDEQTLRREISMSVLVEKLVMELKRILSVNPNMRLELDEEIKVIFFAELQRAVFSEGGQSSRESSARKQQFQRYTNEMNRRFDSLGPWAYENMVMLSSFLEERFELAELIQLSKQECDKAKGENEHLKGVLEATFGAKEDCEAMLQKLKAIFNSYSPEKQGSLEEIQRFIQEASRRQEQGQNGQGRSRAVRSQQFSFNEANTIDIYESKLREKQATINELHDRIYSMQRQRVDSQGRLPDSRISSQEEYVRRLESDLSELRASKGMLETRADFSKFEGENNRVQEQNSKLQAENSGLKIELQNARLELKVLHENEKFIMRRADEQSQRVQEGHTVNRSLNEEFNSIHNTSNNGLSASRRGGEMRPFSEAELSQSEIRQVESRRRDYAYEDSVVGPLARNLSQSHYSAQQQGADLSRMSNTSDYGLGRPSNNLGAHQEHEGQRQHLNTPISAIQERNFLTRTPQYEHTMKMGSPESTDLKHTHSIIRNEESFTHSQHRGQLPTAFSPGSSERTTGYQRMTSQEKRDHDQRQEEERKKYQYYFRHDQHGRGDRP